MRTTLFILVLLTHNLSLHAMSSPSQVEPEWAQPPQKSSPENAADLPLQQKFIALIQQHYKEEDIQHINNRVQQSHKNARFNIWTQFFNDFHTKTCYNSSKDKPKGMHYLSDRGEFIEAMQQLFNNKKS